MSEETAPPPEPPAEPIAPDAAPEVPPAAETPAAPEPVSSASAPPAHGTNTDTTHRFCRCPECESARRGYRV